MPKKQMLTPHSSTFFAKNLFFYFICYNFDAMITYTTMRVVCKICDLKW